MFSTFFLSEIKLFTPPKLSFLLFCLKTSFSVLFLNPTHFFAYQNAEEEKFNNKFLGDQINGNSYELIKKHEYVLSMFRQHITRVKEKKSMNFNFSSFTHFGKENSFFQYQRNGEKSRSKAYTTHIILKVPFLTLHIIIFEIRRRREYHRKECDIYDFDMKRKKCNLIPLNNFQDLISREIL